MNWHLPALHVRLSTSEQPAVAVVVEDDAEEEEAADDRPMNIEGQPKRMKVVESLETS